MVGPVRVVAGAPFQPAMQFPPAVRRVVIGADDDRAGAASAAEAAQIIGMEGGDTGAEIGFGQHRALLPTGILSISRVPPIRAATSRRAGEPVSAASGARLSASARAA